MEPLYNVYFGGEALPGEEIASVRDRVAKLFNANEATLNKLFNGKLHLVKRGCDKATALKYKQALERAGARPIIKPADDGAPAAPPPPAAEAPTTEAPMSTADKIAALAAAPDLDAYRSDDASAASSDSSQPSEPSADDDEVGDLDLAPPESDVLRPDERAPEVHRDVDTGDLEVNAEAEDLAEPSPPPPPAPNVSHLSMGEVGESIPSLDHGEAPPPPNTDALSLSPEGTDFSDCQAAPAEAPELDLSSLDVAPQGSDVLEEQYRKKPAEQAPDTDHISLED